MRHLLWISCLTWLLGGCASRQLAPSFTPPLFDTLRLSQYRTLIKVQGAEITGLLLLKYIDGQWRGSLVNEFGVKAFDFSSRQGKYKLQNAVPFLDKWYIRRTLAADLRFLLRTGMGKQTSANGRRLQLSPDGSLLLNNDRRKIAYTLQPIAP